VILIDGRHEAFIPALDRGFAYGDGVFRTMRARAGVIPHWQLHYSKLAADCRSLDIVCPAQAVLTAETDEILRVEPDCVLKIIITRGSGGRGYGPPTDPRPLRMIASFPVPESRAGAIESGVRVRWCSTRLALQPALAGVKHLNRLENVLARREWSDGEIAEGLMQDTESRVIEGTTTNLFLLEGDQLITPDLARCGVAGVQRDRLLAIAPQLGLRPSIEAVVPNRLLAAEQILLTNSVIGVWRVSNLGETHWPYHEIVTQIANALERADA